MPPFLVSPDEQKLSPKPPEFHISVRRVCKGLHNVAESLHPAVRQNNPEFAFTIEDFRLPWRFFIASSSFGVPCPYFYTLQPIPPSGLYIFFDQN